MGNLWLNFLFFFVHRLSSKLIQFMVLGLHSLLMAARLLGSEHESFINRKSLLNNNNNNILLL